MTLGALIKNTREILRHTLLSDNAWLIYPALFVLIGHLCANGLYDYQRDEFYYITCGQHPAWGYVDHPPLVPMIARLSQQLFGGSLWGLRFFPAVAGAWVVFLTGLIARELGGNRFAQGMAACAVVIAPLYIASDGLLMPCAFDQLAWTLCTYLIVRLLKTHNLKLWPWIGFVVGISLLNKYSMLFYVGGLLIGLVFAGPRHHFRVGWFWLGVLIASLIALPNLVWQVQHHWATLEFLHSLNRDVMSDISRPQFLLWQIILINPCTLPFWIAGLGYYLFRPEGRPYCVLGWIFVVTLAFLLVMKAKPYYLGSIYPTLLAAGPLALRRGVEPSRWSRLKPALVGMLFVGIALAAPVTLPAVPKETYLRYGVERINRDLAEVLGWHELVGQVAAAVKQRLTPEEQTHVTILTANYGEAGAIDVLGGAYGLPKAISAHNNYYLWGPGDATGEVCIAVGYSGQYLRRFFYDVKLVGMISNSHGIANIEYNRPFYICRRPKRPLAAMWPQLRHYD